MRNLFICFLLVTLVALLQRGPNPMTEPATYLGVLIVYPILGARLFRNWRLPPAVGAIASGIVLSQSGLLGASILESVIPFRDIGFVWLGLYLGTQVARRPTWRAANVASSLSIVVGCTLLICLVTTVLPLTLFERLQIALACAVCAPLFTLLDAGGHHDEIGLTGLATAICLALIGLLHLVSEPLRFPTGVELATAGAILLLVTEFGFRAIRSAISGPGRYLVYILLVGALWLGAVETDCHPAVVGAVFGMLLGARGRYRRETIAPLQEASSLLGPFVIGFVAASADWSRVSTAPTGAWVLAGSMVTAMIAGKLVAGRAARDLTQYRHHNWITVYPIGVAGFEILPATIPDHLFLGLTSYPEEGYLPTLLLGSVVVPLSLCWLKRIIGYVASRRNLAASSGGMK